MAVRDRKSSRRRRDRQGESNRSAPLGNPAYRRLTNPYPPIEILSDDQVEAIHETSMTTLEEIGIKVLLDEARTILRAAGADVDEDSMIVRFDRGLVDSALTTVPGAVTLHGRSPERNVAFGDRNVAFATVGGPPNVSDMENGRRPGSRESFSDLVRLSQSYDVIHIIGPVVEPVDIHLSVRHLEVARTLALNSDKVPFVFARGPDAVADSLEVVRMARGVPEEQFVNEPSCYTVVNANSPLQLDAPMSQGIIDFARAGQLMILTPFTLAGAMAPVSLAGALAQQNAEALAGITLAQLTRPGAPVAYGGFTSNVDMKSGAPAFGTPEYVKAAFATGQLTRKYGIPYRSSNVNASNTPDAQAAYESQMSLWGAVMGGCHILMHGAGWLEGGLTASFEKFIIDIEMLQMMAELFTGFDVDEPALALDAMREVRHGGHYFGAAHTLERYQTAFYSPIVSDWRNFETWSEDGARDTAYRAHVIFKQVLADYQPPAIDDAIRDEIDAFVARRTTEGGVATDF